MTDGRGERAQKKVNICPGMMGAKHTKPEVCTMEELRLEAYRHLQLNKLR